MKNYSKGYEGRKADANGMENKYQERKSRMQTGENEDCKTNMQSKRKIGLTR